MKLLSCCQQKLVIILMGHPVYLIDQQWFKIFILPLQWKRTSNGRGESRTPWRPTWTTRRRPSPCSATPPSLSAVSTHTQQSIVLYKRLRESELLAFSEFHSTFCTYLCTSDNFRKHIKFSTKPTSRCCRCCTAEVCPDWPWNQLYNDHKMGNPMIIYDLWGKLNCQCIT